MAEFAYKGFLICVRRSRNDGGWHATATLRTDDDSQVAFAAEAEQVGDLVRKIETSIRLHRSGWRDPTT